MNTADRSIEALDTALRRRFSFREMPPKHKLILTAGKLKDAKGMIGDIDVVEVLKTINDRIEKLIDKDHKIGHSYFLDIESKDDLKNAFQDKVIPLLEEYFFGDFGKISLVLGKSFITKETTSEVKFAKDNDYDASIANDLLERAVYEVTIRDDWDFKAIYA
jgi:5-methylcytosine-specific restriction protein B